MPTVAITVGGVDITDSVQFATARFVSKVNGTAGTADMRVRDDDSTMSFTIGSHWLLTVDGDAVWSGFVMQVRRVYIFPAEDVEESGLQRFWDLVGADYNLLFYRRFAFKKSDPIQAAGTTFPADTNDSTAIGDLVSNWLDLSTDSIDTSGVTFVGPVDPAQKVQAWGAGTAWGDAMANIAAIPAAIWYLRPSLSGATLVYCDADTATATFGLSDVPDGTTTKGYREMEIILDGTALANDALEWGAGYGTDKPVFSRVTDAASVAAHGTWQQGDLKVGVYKQATIDRIADSIVNGSPAHHRGGKDDRPAVTLTTYEPGLLAGDIVDFESQVWSYTESIPIREMEVTFDAPDGPKYRLMMSHAIDSPWGFFDVAYFRWSAFKARIPSIRLPRVPSILGGSCACIQPVHIFDTFDRADGPIGVSTCGIAWTLGADAYVVSNQFSSAGGDFSTFQESLIGEIGPAFTMTFDIVNLGVSGRVSTWFTLSSTVAGAARTDWSCMVDIQGYGTIVQSVEVAVYDKLRSEGGAVVVDVASGPVSASAGTVTIVMTPGVVSATVDTVSLTATLPSGTVITDAKNMLWDGSSSTNPVVLDSLDISGDVGNLCPAAQFDDFQRSVSSGWGTSTPSGFPWTEGGSGAMTPSVQPGYDIFPGYGKVDQIDDGTTSQGGIVLLYTGDATKGWADDFNFTCEFTVHALPSTAHTGTLGTWGVSLSASLPPSGSIDQGIVVTSRDASYGGSDTLSFVPSSGSPTVVSKSFVVGASYSLRWVKSGSRNQIRVWPSGSAEPSTWAISAVDGGSLTPVAFFVHQNQPFTRTSPSDPTATMGIWWSAMNFDYATRPCYYDGSTPVPPPPGGIPPAGSWGCETLARVSATVYAASTTFAGGATIVWRAGVLQSFGTDYTEDHDRASITFTSSVGSTEAVRMCYFAVPY